YYQGMYPNGINDAGQFVGIYTRGSKIHAYRYSDGIGRKDAPTLVDGGATFLVAISDSGTAVGPSWSGGRYPSDGHAVLFENNTTELVDLNDIALVGDFDDPDRWTLKTQYSINGDYIVGDGLRNGATRAFRLKRSTGAIDQIS